MNHRCDGPAPPGSPELCVLYPLLIPITAPLPLLTASGTAGTRAGNTHTHALQPSAGQGVPKTLLNQVKQLTLAS